jgi:starch synthase (maltosyl-transferring)
MDTPWSSVPARPPSRVVVERVRPEIDGGRFAAKRTVGERVVVTAHVFTDGHDAVMGVLQYRRVRETTATEVPLVPQGNDVWVAGFDVTSLEPYVYTVEAWLDTFGTWRHGLSRKADAGQDVSVELQMGAALVREAAGRAPAAEGAMLLASAAVLAGEGDADPARRLATALDRTLLDLMHRHQERRSSCRYGRELRVDVERERARFSAWYELFPRSASPTPGRHGTLADCAARLPYVADMGFDILYLPPIHPIGREHRKGRNNARTSGPGDVGSPWAIGAAEGGHTAVHPDLGTVDDLRRLVAAARERGLEVAMDLAFQCAPDHPWVRMHPQWFKWRPDGTVQYAENPPKKYEDIYPLDFENGDWQGLWTALRDVVLHWVDCGVAIFRVDNPHTKPFRFWEWLIAEVRRGHPEVMFLSEAFTRPKVMSQLAKLGFSQSYTYFTWRTTKREIEEYMTELTRGELADTFRPSFWPNTPDILPEHLQWGGRPMFVTRAVLAATLAASWGIYGPAYELLESRPLAPGKEEYLDSEKYELRHWDTGHPDSLAPLLTRLNRIRRENPALHADRSLRFHATDNEQVVAYSKRTEDLQNVILTVVNLDPHHEQSAHVEFPAAELGLEAEAPYQVHDLLSDARFFWHGASNFVALHPVSSPAHVFRVRRRVRTERDFDYFL